ncbi:MAG: nuclear transport factor 2 family protein [Pseudohongiellaceae bacterium]
MKFTYKSCSHGLMPAFALALLATLAQGQPSLAPPPATLIDGLPVPVVAHPDQLSLLGSANPQLAANKQLVFDMHRSVFAAGQGEAIDRYFRRDYQEHSQIRLNGLDALKTRVAAEIPRLEEVPATLPDLVTLIAEGDYVMLAQVSHYAEPDGSGKTYTSTRFDLYRVQDGLIAEHWDGMQLRPGLGIPPADQGGPLPVTGVQGLAQHSMLMNPDPQLFANKRLAYDLWRHLPEAGREEIADLYVDPIYIQHNPNAATGRDGMKEYFTRRPDSSIDTWLEDPLVASLAEGDLVLQVLQEQRPHPDTGETYYVAWFDLFRVHENRLIEHWDTASKGEYPVAMQPAP